MSTAEKQASRNLKNQRRKETAQMGDSMRNFVSIGSVHQQPHADDNSTEQQEIDFLATGFDDDKNTSDDERVDGVLPERVELNVPNVRRERFGELLDENLGIDEDSSSGGGGDDDDDDDDDPEIDLDAKSPMQTYLRKVRERLIDETKQNKPALYDCWLLSFLKRNDWTIQAYQAKFICKKLGVEFSEPAYCRKIIVWLPDVQFGSLLPCPNDDCNNFSCRFHCWRDDHIARRVVDLCGHYFVISRRYKCCSCETRAAAIKTAQKEHESDLAEAFNSDQTDNAITKKKEVSLQYTFMGYNPKTLQLLPDGLGDEFPAYLTHRSGVDMGLIDLMRPLYQAGIKPKQFRDLLEEFARKKHSREWLKRENRIARTRRLNPDFSTKEDEMFGNFEDKSTYDGYVPSSQYLASVYKKSSKDIRHYLLRELKKRPAKWLRWDVSYKEPKKLCRYKGSPIFKGLVTACNELGEMRLQFHVVTDSHDQMVNALAAYKDTVGHLGQEMPEIVFSDNPSSDYYFFREHLPSIVDYEKQLNDKYSSTVEFTGTGLPHCEIDPHDICYVETEASINEAINLLRTHLTNNPHLSRVLGLDEEHEYGSKIQCPPNGRGRVALIQIGYEFEPGRIKAILIKTSALPKNATLPNSLIQLFKDCSFSYAGVRIKNDIERITDDFKCAELQQTMTYIEVGHMAKDRGIVDDARVGLQKLTLLVLKENMSKENEVRSSKWNNRKLTDSQKAYAAIDATKSLEVYLQLAKMKCYASRLKSREAVSGVKVDIIAPRGRVGSTGMGTVQAVGTILEGEAGDTPEHIQRMKTRGPPKETRVIQIESISGLSCKVPGYKKQVPIDAHRPGLRQKKKDRAVVLGDFVASLPCKVELPLTMLKHFNPGSTERQPAALATMTIAGKETPVGPAEQRPPQPDNPWTLLPPDDTLQPVEDDGQLEQSLKDAAELSAKEMAEIRLCAIVAKQQLVENDMSCKLDPPPAKIADVFRTVLGDPWHFMDRPKVDVKHDKKKAYFVAFMEAWFAWDPVLLEKIKQTMSSQDGMTDAEIEAEMYYNAEFFIQCIERAVLPPSVLYWRVRAVFCTFGIMKDSKTGKPLFNARAWRKAKGVLKNILQGFASDPPGVPMYAYQIDENGEPKMNKYGFHKLHCLRGTNLTECAHRQMLQSIGTISTGIEMSDCVQYEMRHRYNHRMSIRRRPGFPDFGHYDTWLIDGIQCLVEENHNTLVYPTWSNGLDWDDTPEMCGTVPLQPSELTDAVNGLSITPKLTPEQQYLSAQQGTSVCFLPFTTKEEKKLYARLALGNPELLKNDGAMALEIVKHVDGKNVFPKLEAYIRTYREKYQFNLRVEDAVKDMDSEIKRLQEFNTETLPILDNTSEAVEASSNPPDSEILTQHSQDGGSDIFDDDANSDDNVLQGSQGDRTETVAAAMHPCNKEMNRNCNTDNIASLPTPPVPWTGPVFFPCLQRIPPQLAASRANSTAIAPPRQGQFVGRTQIGVTSIIPQPTTGKEWARGKDKNQRKKRRCTRCVQFNGPEPEKCKGAHGGKTGGSRNCQHFTENGEQKE